MFEKPPVEERATMKSLTGIIAILAAFLYSLSCSENPIQEEIAVPHYELVSTGSPYGVEIGDSLSMIGSIDDICHHPDGSILILDMAAMRVRLVKDGEVTFITSAGEGPGEMIYPQSVCCLPGGEILVADEGKREVMKFNIAGEYLGSYLTSDRYVPMSMFPVDSTSIEGSILELQMGEELILFSVNFGRFDSETTPTVLFDRKEWEWPAPEMYTDIGKMDHTAASDGTFYLTMNNTDYFVSVYAADGELADSISRQDIPRLPKTDMELQGEIEEFERNAVSDQAYTGGYEPYPFYPIISFCGVDSDGNLWIERLDRDHETEGCFFDVWNSSGNLEYTVSYREPEAFSGITFRIDQYGILGCVVDSDLFPRVLFLELQ